MQAHANAASAETCHGCGSCGGDCAAARCPICAEPFRPGVPPCPHLLAAVDGDCCTFAPFDLANLQFLAATGLLTWDSETLREALGPAAGLLAAFPPGAATPDLPRLLEAVIGRLSFPVERLERADGRRYYAAKGVIARQQAGHLVERLRRGLRRLAQQA